MSPVFCTIFLLSVSEMILNIKVSKTPTIKILIQAVTNILNLDEKFLTKITRIKTVSNVKTTINGIKTYMTLESLLL